MNIEAVENGPVLELQWTVMGRQEVVLEFRLSSPNAFECSACRKTGIRTSFPTILSIEDLVVAFREHVESEHSGQYSTANNARREWRWL